MKNKKIIVTGATRGLGFEIAKLASQSGFEVCGSYRKEADIEKLQSIGCHPLQLDQLDRTSIQYFCDSALDWSEGSLFALVNNAGTTYPSALEEMTPEDLRKQFEVNLFGPLEITQRCLPALQKSKGRIVMISSLSVAMTSPLTSAYSATKRALDAFSECLAMEQMPFGVDVSVIHPGGYETNIWDSAAGHGDQYHKDSSKYYPFMKGVQRAVAKQKLRDPKEVAEVCLEALQAKHPKFDYRCPKSIRKIFWMRQIVPFKKYFEMVNKVVWRPTST